jgi:alcohol dehydrogenase class IV
MNVNVDEIAPFEYENVAGRIAFGRGRVADVGGTIADLGARRALVVCGSNVGANRDTMDPVEAGLGDRLAGVFDGTTPEKSVESVYEGLAAMDEHDADALVAVGGGSSIDTARAMRAVREDGRSYDELRENVAEHGALPLPDDPVPLAAVPTTLAGADLSTGGSVVFRDGSDLAAGYADPVLMPDALAYDPELFETTPTGALVGSAMNGFDKGLEAVYARNAAPLTDAPALHGLELLRPSLPDVRDPDDPAVMDAVVAGIVLVQYPRATRGGGLLSLIHAFGHGLREQGVQQGVAHAVMAPPALEYLFGEVDGRRDVLADAFGVADADNRAAAVVESVADVRDGMGLPAALRELEAVKRDALSEIAAYVAEDRFLRNAPEGLEPTEDDLLGVLEAAW